MPYKFGIMKKAKQNNLLRKTLRISTIEGTFSQVYGTFAMIGSRFIGKLMIILQASPTLNYFIVKYSIYWY